LKIAQSVRDTFQTCEAIYKRLAQDVEERLKPLVEAERWFYIARVKALESYALKLETGRVADPAQPEDFFACTIVVNTLGEIEAAERIAGEIFDLVERRPKADQDTHKRSSSFDFDDLRLYVRQRESTSGKNADLDGLPFEIQIKTILQHAWSMATHDLIYKTDTVSWARERIAFQVKAMLEHAEIAIAEANRLADAPAVAKKDSKTAETLVLIEKLGNIWSNDQLPTDRKRLAENILQLLRTADLRAGEFDDLIDVEKRRIGLLPANLSPYAFCLQALANSQTLGFQAKFCRKHIRTKLLVHGDMDLPQWISDGHERIIAIGWPVQNA
jgi:ppGpp synthetase/RelA/SpoT-type nucleotidyltranferase